jgi:hypothetical protein
LVDQREPRAALGIEALAKGGARGRLRQAQGAQREGARAQRLDGLEVALALAQQPQDASHDVAVGDARAHREGRVDQGIEVDALQILPDERQTGVRDQVVGQLLDDEVGHRALTCRVSVVIRLSHCFGERKRYIFGEGSRIQVVERLVSDRPRTLPPR